MISDYGSFYKKYKSKENEDGYIAVTDEVLSDIKALAKKRGYASDWQEFLLYATQDGAADEEFYSDKGITKEILCNKIWEWEGFRDVVFNVEFLNDNTYRMSYRDYPSGYETGEYEINDGILTINPSMRGLTPEDLANYQPGYIYGSGDYILQSENLIVSVDKLPVFGSGEYVTHTFSTTGTA